jgi:TRAP-type uncharacterized transport system fused permease subunit
MSRKLEGTIGKVVDFFSVILTLFALQVIVLGPRMGYNKSLAIFLVLALPMTFFIYAGGKSQFFMKINVVDIAFAILSLVSIGYLVVNAEYILTRVEYVSP